MVNNSPAEKKPKKLHRWKNFPGDCKLAEEFEQKNLEFEDSTVKLRMKIAAKYGVIYHCPYFTKKTPDARIPIKTVTKKNGK